MEKMKKSKLLIYPFQGKDIPTVKYLPFLNSNYDIEIVCANEGSGLIGHDVSFSENRKELGITVDDNLESLIDKIDIVLIPSVEDQCLQNLVKKKIIDIMLKKRDVICLMSLSKSERQNLKKIARANGTKIIFNKQKRNRIQEETLMLSGDNWYNPTAPIVFVCGVLECGNQAEIIFSLAKLCITYGIRPCCLGKDKIFELINQYSYQYLFETNISEINKIKSLNNLLRKVCEQKKPDIIFVEIPGTLVRFSNFIVNDFGINAYIFSQAVIPDYVICADVFGIHDENAYEPMSDDFQGKFGFRIDCIHQTNKMPNVILSMEKNQMFFFKIPFQVVDSTVCQLNVASKIPVYNLINEEEQQVMFLQMIKKLEI